VNNNLVSNFFTIIYYENLDEYFRIWITIKSIYKVSYFRQQVGNDIYKHEENRSTPPSMPESPAVVMVEKDKDKDKVVGDDSDEEKEEEEGGSEKSSHTTADEVTSSESECCY